MMELSRKQELVNLFKNYRYSFLKERDGVLVFEYASGMYSAVEIVPVNKGVKKDEIERIKNDYSRAGYATHVYEECDIESIQKDLFNGFFQTKLSNKKIKHKYWEYCERVMMQFGKKAEDYNYIEVPYELEKDFYSQDTRGSIIDSIFSLLNCDGAKLIILEAPAGFGKTSTTYEILHRFQNVEEDIRPFMMELYKDRTASIFKYVLLSNIDRDFDVSIKSEIVIENIKAGRIPLLVDGFDELLSRDINDKNRKVEFKEIESMLSTIADLLKGNAKILLTSRKTAIFSGEEFFEWYDKLIEKGLDFQVIKYSINNPTIYDWLEPRVVDQYGKDLLSALNNPVLLGFIKYCGGDMECGRVNIVDRFFDLLLSREIKRQDLPFNVEEQKEIMRRLALTMAGLNCSSDTRTWIMSWIAETSRNLLLSKITASRDMDSMLNSLANHALLNRKNDKIGFLNDFIYGAMLTDAFLNITSDGNIIDPKEISFEFLDKCIKASVFFEKDTRIKIRDSLHVYTSMNETNNVICDWKLKGEFESIITGMSFDGERFTDCVFGTQQNIISNCTFSNIEFCNCAFDFDYLKECTFVKCSFENCVKNGNNYSCFNYGCNNADELLLLDEDKTLNVQEAQTDDDVKISILQKYFLVGSQRRRMKLISIVRKDFIHCEKQFKRCLDSLASNNYLIVNGDKSFITDEGVQWYISNQKEA